MDRNQIVKWSSVNQVFPLTKCRKAEPQFRLNIVKEEECCFDCRIGVGEDVVKARVVGT